MKEGARFTLFIPAYLAYVENNPPSIGPNQALVFDVELIEIVDPIPQ
jgi:FKBP-type peptidyl-prolyl cis-trans isomerase FklB